jgi:VIT1/CCC1 family predicted Fe2+/Mn2+ transporter
MVLARFLSEIVILERDTTMSFAKRMETARRAFAHKNIDEAALAHNPRWIAQAAQEKHEEPHSGTGFQYIGDMVYGGLDGIITTFAVVSGVAGAHLATPVILILGLANLFADGFSMATGAYLSMKSEQEYYHREWQRELWEVKQLPAGERQELYEAYRQKGYSVDDAQELVKIQTRDTQRWVKAMMVDELGLLSDDRKPLYSGLVTFSSFILAGATPLLVYLLGLSMPVPAAIAFPISLLLSALALFALGAAKVFVTGLNFFRSGLEMLLVGGLAAGVAYGVGALLSGLNG